MFWLVFKVFLFIYSFLVMSDESDKFIEIFRDIMFLLVWREVFLILFEVERFFYYFEI